jgi:hypothetical protein
MSVTGTITLATGTFSAKNLTTDAVSGTSCFSWTNSTGVDQSVVVDVYFNSLVAVQSTYDCRVARENAAASPLAPCAARYAFQKVTAAGTTAGAGGTKPIFVAAGEIIEFFAYNASETNASGTYAIINAAASDMVRALGAALVDGVAGYLAAAINTWGNVATPVATAASVNQTATLVQRGEPPDVSGIPAATAALIDLSPLALEATSGAIVSALESAGAILGTIQSSADEAARAGDAMTLTEAYAAATTAAQAGDEMTLTAAYDAAKTAAQAGDEMDLVPAPNATAILAIQTPTTTGTTTLTIHLAETDGDLVVGATVWVSLQEDGDPACSTVNVTDDAGDAIVTYASTLSGETAWVHVRKSGFDTSSYPQEVTLE